MPNLGYIVDEKIYKLMLENTGEYVILDQKDFDAAKHTKWYALKGQPVTRTGTKLVEYLAIVGDRKELAPKNDYRRRWYA